MFLCSHAHGQRAPPSLGPVLVVGRATTISVYDASNASRLITPYPFFSFCPLSLSSNIGGYDAMTVYALGDAPKPEPQPEPTGDFTVVGCTTDDPLARVRYSQEWDMERGRKPGPNDLGLVCEERNMHARRKEATCPFE